MSQKNSYILLGIIQGHAPTASAQALMSIRYNEICTQIALDFESGHELQTEKAMAGILNDGLSHGNWPWSDFTVRNTEPNPFQVGDRVREVAQPPKVEGPGTVILTEGSATTVKWDKVGYAHSSAHHRYFVTVVQ